ERGGMLLFGDVAELAHPSQHVRPAIDRILRAVDGIDTRRPLRNAGEDRRLRERQLVERLAEIGLRGGGDTVRALAEEGRVEEELEDLFLRELLLDAQREDPLLELAHERQIARQKILARHLLRDRAAARHSLAAGEN